MHTSLLNVDPFTSGCFGEHSGAYRPLSLAQALGVKRINDDTYEVDMHPDHCHGNYAHGGLCVSQIQHALRQYFENKHQHLKEQDAFRIQIMFIAPVPAAAVTVKLGDVNIGRNLSTIHIRLQHQGKDKIVGHAACTNLATPAGPSYPMPAPLYPSPPPADFEKMGQNVDPYWIRYTYPWDTKDITKTFLHAERWVPRRPGPLQVCEFWFRQLPVGERITTEMLGSLSDQFPRVPENWRAGSNASHARVLAHAYWQQRTHDQSKYGKSEAPRDFDQIESLSQAKNSTESPRSTFQQTQTGQSPNADPKEMLRQSLMYPTIGMSLEIRKLLPEEGVEWLYLRAITKGVRNGRMDTEVVLIDEQGDIIALGNQAGMMLGMSKSTQPRKMFHASSKM